MIKNLSNKKLNEKGFTSFVIVIIAILVLGIGLIFIVYSNKPENKNKNVLAGSTWKKIPFLNFILNTEPSKKPPEFIGPPEKEDNKRVPLLMFFIKEPEESNLICDYKTVGISVRAIRTPDGFDTSLFDEAKACGTSVVFMLNNQTDKILTDSGVGIDLQKIESIAQTFDGVIDPYINDGTIVAVGIVDEPHDCGDWGGECPTPQQVDEASMIIKNHWPNAKTITNTLPTYLFNNEYKFEYTDIVQFQFAFHKYKPRGCRDCMGDYNKFVSDAVAAKEQGYFKEISWALQVKSGGCNTFQGCSMTPEQFSDVSTAMCLADNTAQHLAFVFYDTTLLTPEMLQSIDSVNSFCDSANLQ